MSAVSTVPLGWDRRYDMWPAILREVERIRSGGRFVHLFRGDSRPPSYLAEIHTIGLKALGAFGRLRGPVLTARQLAEDEQQFTRIAVAFAGSRMAKRKCRGITAEEILAKWRELVPACRFVLARALVDSLQYQNSQSGIRELRDQLPVISFSRSYGTALKYALKDRPKESLVFEYAPPMDSGLFTDVADLVSDFQDHRLGGVFTDVDHEVFVWYAALPHYLLGYSALRRRGDKTYSCEFVANPHFDGSATLDNPPDINAEQQHLIRQTRIDMDWFMHERDQWRHSFGRDGRRPLDAPH